MCAVSLLRMPVKTPGECHFGIPYGVPGLCQAWQTDNAHGPKRRPKPAYRTTMVVHTYFGDFSV